MVAVNNPNSKDLIAFREVIQLFIDGKMNSYNKIKVTCDVMGKSITIDKRKYRASLFMLHKMLRTMEINGFMNVRIVIRICTILLHHLKIQVKSTYENFTMNKQIPYKNSF